MNSTLQIAAIVSAQTASQGPTLASPAHVLLPPVSELWEIGT